MDYFLESEKLVIEPEFVKIASKLYARFIKMDPEYYIKLDPEAENPFDLTIKSWEHVCKQQEPKRTIGVYNVPFIWYAGEELVKQFLHKDWEDFRNANSENKTNDKSRTLLFLQQLESLRTRLQTKTYLGPVASKLNQGVQTIKEHYSMTNSDTSPRFEDKRLKWNGQLDTLYTLFFDLSNKRSKATKQHFLEADKAQIIAFIMDNFVDQEGKPLTSPDSIKTYLEPSRLDKKATKDRFVLQHDYKEPEAKK